MKKLLLFLLFPFSVQAADIYISSDSAGNKISLMDEPCDVSSGWLKLKRATFLYQGKEYKACWVVAGSTVLVFDDLGDVTGVPVSSFRKQEAI